jgi:hypothetical protein
MTMEPTNSDLAAILATAPPNVRRVVERMQDGTRRMDALSARMETHRAVQPPAPVTAEQWERSAQWQFRSAALTAEFAAAVREHEKLTGKARALLASIELTAAVERDVAAAMARAESA